MNVFEFNKVYVIESLVNERRTGLELYDDIIKIRGNCNDIDTEFVSVQSLQEWKNTIEQIKERVEKNNIIPILHLELHGSNLHDGLVLSNNEIIYWYCFVEDMRCINIKTKNNLFITMGVCFGMDILKHTSYLKPTPFFGIIGSLYTLYNDDIYIRYSDFYNEFLQSRDLSKSLVALFKANPNRPQEYSFVNAQELFHRVYENYLRTEFSKEAIKKRANDSIDKLGIAIAPKDREKWVRKFEEELKKTKELYFQEHINGFLMSDKFESCKMRFSPPLTTEEFLNEYREKMITNLIN